MNAPNRFPRRDDRAAINLVTVDLEDWFHICEVEHVLPRRDWDGLPSTVVQDTEKLLEILQASQVRATFFVLGYVADKHPELVARIHRLGHEIGYHGWDHELIYRLAPTEFRRMLRRGVECLASITGVRPVGFRAPQWSINDLNPWALEVLAEEGYLYDSSRIPLRFIGNECYPRQPHALHLSTGLLWEIPPLVLRTPWGNYPAGGGWGLRCLPYAMIRRQVNRLNGKQIPALFYFHPREVGPPRKIVGLPFIKRFVLEAGIWSTKDHLSRLLADFKFIPIREYLGIDQEKPSPWGLEPRHPIKEKAAKPCNTVRFH
ncbi:MAG TPA: polysaccharide deacetylase [Syntrophobacteraceae bacterium]|nr:polysaccharide deacetylase [Syntrophobacteraceae bacterium]